MGVDTLMYTQLSVGMDMQYMHRLYIYIYIYLFVQHVCMHVSMYVYVSHMQLGSMAPFDHCDLAASQRRIFVQFFRIFCETFVNFER